MNLKFVNDEPGWAHQPDDTKRADFNRSDRYVELTFTIGLLRMLRDCLQRFVKHSRDDILQPIATRDELYGHALTVAQDNEVVGNVQKLFQKMTDINHSY